MAQLDRRSIFAQFIGFVICIAIVLAATAVSSPYDQASSTLRVLVFSKTAGFRHGSIPAGITAIKKLGQQNGFAVEVTEDAAQFAKANLARFSTVIFLNTTGDVLDKDQQTAFERFIQCSGGYLGIHAAADTEYDWPWYGRLVGAYFKTHPAIQDATIVVADRVHPSTKHLPIRWQRRDEWYEFRANPRGEVHVLATIDERTYQGGGMGHDHPIAWCHKFDGGRSFYTAGGHTNESYAEPAFLQHILGGIRWTAGVTTKNKGEHREPNPAHADGEDR